MVAHVMDLQLPRPLACYGGNPREERSDDPETGLRATLPHDPGVPRVSVTPWFLIKATRALRAFCQVSP